MLVGLARFGSFVFVAALLAAPAWADDQAGWQSLGMARVFANDTIADRQDRWRSGGYGISAFRGAEWFGALPSQPFEIMEYRLRGEVMAPDNLARPVPSAAEIAADEADPIFRGAFVVTDQRKLFTIVPINLGDAAEPVLLFLGEMPPPERDLTVLHCSERTMRMTPSERPSVICFTPGTRLRIETGETAIEDLGPGDKLLTRDSGPQEVLWSGHRRMSGARLFAMPQQRPIRLRRGALGVDRPEDDLIVSPEHRVLVKGRAARDLWGED